MLDKLNKLKLFVRLQAVFNIVLVIILIFYLCQVVISEYLEESHNSYQNVPSFCWIIWITLVLIAIIIIPLQMTADVFLFKDMNDTLRSIQKYEQWLRISTLFIITIMIGLILSIFCPLSPTEIPIGGFILLFINILSRFLGMVLVYKYKFELQLIVLETTTTNDGGSRGTNSNGYDRSVSGGRSGRGGIVDGSCRSISISPDLIVISNYDRHGFTR